MKDVINYSGIFTYLGIEKNEILAKANSRHIQIFFKKSNLERQCACFYVVSELTEDITDKYIGRKDLQ